MNLKQEQIYATVSAQVSAIDGIVTATPVNEPGIQLPPVGFGTGVGSVSLARYDGLELVRRMFTHIDSPSATIVSGGSAGAVAIAFGTSGVCGIMGKLQGWPFLISAAGTLSGSPSSAFSTTSSQIRKVLVTLSLSALPVASSIALGAGTIGFVYGSAMNTSANAVTSGGQGLSYFDYVPLPLPSAGEIPMGWLNFVNSCSPSAHIVNSCMFTDWRAVQGINLSAMMRGLPQP